MALLVLAPAGSSAAASAGSFAADDEAAYVARINAVREANGLGPLRLDRNMTDAARRWTAWMVDNTTLAHADDIVTGAPSDWLKVGENVGRGSSVESVWQAFLASPSHAANVLDPEYDLVGVGVVWNAEGRMYTTHRFASTASAEPAPAPPAPDPPAPPPPAPTAPSADRVAVKPLRLPFLAYQPPAPAPDPGRIATTMALLLAAR